MRKGSYVSIWNVRKGNGNYHDVQISCSRKRKDTGEYARDFNGYVRFCGPASDAIASHEGFNAKDNGNQPLKIRLGDIDISNNYNKEKGTTYWNVVVFNYENSDEAHQMNQNANNPVDVPEDSNGELPF